ncbi:MAG TPA: cytochrome c [Gammaproteobacteria bacterium]|nr:cytochrome c [Gammaproteobacteria bacterium]
MKIRILLLSVLTVGLATAWTPGFAAGAGRPFQELKLSPEVLNLLRAEMRGISAGVQGMSLSIATGDWKSIQQTSHNIRASYIMEKKLTPAQAQELKTALPARFKRLDAEFHERAGKLAAAAAAHDAERVTFQYSRLLESCAVCHSEFARSRFPGFKPLAGGTHGH